jgi:CheY-like chemotaxis protein
MPEMSGLEMARRIETIRPGIKILFMSGYVSDEAIDQAVREGSVPFIQKPFTPDALALAIRSALE